MNLPMRTLCIPAALFLASAVGLAAPPEVPAALSVKTGQLTRLAVKGDKIGFVASFKDDEAFFEELTQKPGGPHRFVFQATKPGTYHLAWWIVGEDAGSSTTITVVDPAPPAPPQPPPGPTPPVPPTPAADAPIPAPGLHVLVIFDRLTISTLSEAQKGAIYGGDVRGYLNATCPKGPNGVTAEWRMWGDKDDASGESVLWQTAFKRPRTSLPWVIVSNGKTGFEGPLPGTAADFLVLLKKYGDK